MQINLNLNKELFSPVLYPLLLDYSHRFEMYKGSAASGKSYFITQKIILRCLREPIKVLVCRRYASTIRNSVFALFKEILAKWKLLPYVKIKETDFSMTFPNGSQIIYCGLDEETKLLSLANISCIFIEEVFEVSQDVFEQLNLRMRGNAKNQQIIAAFNPISKEHWLYDFCVVNPPQSFFFSETTYKDNPFVSKEYTAAIEGLKDRNPRKYKIYALGEWGVIDEGLVFKNWKEEDFDIEIISNSGYERRAGSDLGYVDPTTIVDTFYDKQHSRIYVAACFYRSSCQLDYVAQEMERMIGKRVKCYMDCAEPRSIDFFRLRGFNTVPCIKGQNSVTARISFLQNNEIIVHPSCKDLIRELQNFSYIKDNKTGKYTEKTTHEYSHGIDALGYAYSDVYTNKQLKTFDKKILGL